MFFGASGLLTLYPHDAYTLDLARDFEYLAAKYDIEPLDAGVWELDEIRPPTIPYCVWHRRPSSSYRTNS